MLGAASQMILTAGYYRQSTSSAEFSLMEAEKLHQKRLFWRAYILDQELSLRLGKPPLFSEELVDSLPEVVPFDKYGLINLHDGSTLNYFREQVVLAMLQSQVCRNLRSPRSSNQSCEDFLAEYFSLQDKIHRWEVGLNVPLDMTSITAEIDIGQSEGIALLQLGYHQTLIAIHSAIFLHLPLFDNSAIRHQVPAAIGRCAKSGRDLISIFNIHYQVHPLALYFVNNIPWNIDGLFLHMMQNKRRVETRNDLQLLKALLEYVQGYVPRYREDPGFISVGITHRVAMEVIDPS
ncbi:hypothetical protein NW762_005413 [Fusarium torreyae]|uniref:Xylanolytic transcriptional activator regulatory domain-containing protein n=1 Tax=Fusarium torreyae TaxID=1237075 RepID=A0A9W8S2I3_9HYPO|nr:hypothetical protein NW762_005413 [Fusarium torreyae]